jgi:hypothetical protein
MNQLAVEASNRVAWMYDQQLWDDLVDRIRRHEQGLDVSKEFTTVTHDTQRKIADQLAASRQKDKTPQPAGSSSSKTPYAPPDSLPTPSNPTKVKPGNKGDKGGKGTKGGKGGKVKKEVSQQTASPKGKDKGKK